jgi:hypothetical protein
MVAVIVCTLISVAALVIRMVLFLKHMRRRRRELRGIGQRREYALLLDGKIEDAERQCMQVYIGIALACCEDLPMGGIGLYFLSTQYAIPPFIIVSLFTSALLLGVKIAGVTTLRYWFGKLKKWRASRPAGESRSFTTSGHVAHIAKSIDSVNPEWQVTEPRWARSSPQPAARLPMMPSSPL